ncbi:hypothetical protein LCER1_G008685 [Lachnellula cervina]|uniref:DUF7726 domain-containing protein n=1 Tax=Lachnellula cervina TaxID=1316786 RepID=A0A7D8YJQ0_9HELO|nr:hypothetical protein LCER1_G008685 [Lachnellula cervina]
MPKTEPTQSGTTRAEAYPAIKPGDRPRGTNSKPSAPKALADKPAKALNATSRAKNFLQTIATPKKVEPKVEVKPTKRVSVKDEDKPTTKDSELEAHAKPVKKRASTKSDDEPTTKKSKSSKSSTDKPVIESSTNDASSTKPSSFLDITLPTHLPSGEIPIYDTCSTIRQKINALLGKDNTKPENGIPGQFKKDGTPKPYTQAQFLRDIGGGNNASLGRFLKAKKIMGGAESPIYPGAYEFFEKKRIWQAGKKTKGREKVEKDRPDGLPLQDPNHMRMWLGPGESMSDLVDEYGQ